MMETKIADNIKHFRREKNLTQEQLAEALGVTVGAVYKWENGRSVPEIGMLMQLADLFEVSLDALVAFEVRGGGVIALAQRIHELQQQKNYGTAITEAENALLRYPNDFRIVYRTGKLYGVAGMELQNSAYLYRCIDLLEHAILLLPQNTDPTINEISIKTKIATCYMDLGKLSKGIEILKKYNVCGIHDVLIATALTSYDAPSTHKQDWKLEDAVPFLTGAFASLVSNAFRTMMAYANYFCKKSDYISARETLLWLINFLESIKIDQETSGFVDKILAPCYAECANLSMLLGDSDIALPYMRRAYKAATRFDLSPTHKFENMKFSIGDIQNAIVYDDIGESAREAVIKQITQEDDNLDLLGIWETICAEEAANCAE